VLDTTGNSVERQYGGSERLEMAKRGINKFPALINRFLSDGGKRLKFHTAGFDRDTWLKGVAGLSPRARSNWW
jgi:hypothetical protein